MKTDIPHSGPAKVLPIITILAAFIGELGSLILLIRASANTPTILFVLFVFWVSSPFVGFALFFIFATRWRPSVRIMLLGVAILVAAGALLIYGQVIPPPAGSRPGFIWLVTPGISWLLMIGAAVAAALISRRSSAKSRKDNP